jgi:hypothetical protein
MKPTQRFPKKPTGRRKRYPPAKPKRPALKSPIKEDAP